MEKEKDYKLKGFKGGPLDGEWKWIPKAWPVATFPTLKTGEIVEHIYRRLGQDYMIYEKNSKK